MITGMCRRFVSSFNSSNTSSPFICGISTSSTMTSKSSGAHQIERLRPVLRGRDLMPVALEAPREHQAVHGIVVDDQDRGPMRHRSNSTRIVSSSAVTRSKAASIRFSVRRPIEGAGRRDRLELTAEAESETAPKAAALAFSVSLHVGSLRSPPPCRAPQRRHLIGTWARNVSISAATDRFP